MQSQEMGKPQDMGDTASLTVLFSGRFDRPHVGHVATIQRLGRRFKKVLVVVLDYPERTYSAAYAAQMLREVLANSTGNYEVVINCVHFARITKVELDTFKFDVYASGNHECLNHLASFGRTILFTERAYDYEATDDRTILTIKKALGKM